MSKESKTDGVEYLPEEGSKTAPSRAKLVSSVEGYKKIDYDYSSSAKIETSGKDLKEPDSEIKALSNDELYKKSLVFILGEIDRVRLLFYPGHPKFVLALQYLKSLQRAVQIRLDLELDRVVFDSNQHFEKLEGRLNNHRHEVQMGLFSSKPEY